MKPSEIVDEVKNVDALILHNDSELKERDKICDEELQRVVALERDRIRRLESDGIYTKSIAAEKRAKALTSLFPDGGDENTSQSPEITLFHRLDTESLGPCRVVGMITAHAEQVAGERPESTLHPRDGGPVASYDLVIGLEPIKPEIPASEEAVDDFRDSEEQVELAGRMVSPYDSPVQEGVIIDVQKMDIDVKRTEVHSTADFGALASELFDRLCDPDNARAYYDKYAR